ncbi:MAG: hypothetical protein MMC23_009097 [Stictis urceolatum]|nr:hypothetical protein [Stictis urceolata]
MATNGAADYSSHYSAPLITILGRAECTAKATAQVAQRANWLLLRHTSNLFAMSRVQKNMSGTAAAEIPVELNKSKSRTRRVGRERKVFYQVGWEEDGTATKTELRVGGFALLAILAGF